MTQAKAYLTQPAQAPTKACTGPNTETNISLGFDTRAADNTGSAKQDPRKTSQLKKK